MQRLCVLLLLVVFALPAAAGDLAKGVSQRVIRFNVTRGQGVAQQTLADCFDSENCLIQLTRALEQSGGNPGLLRQGETGLPVSHGLRHSFNYVPAKGEQFCAVELLKPSVAPTFLSRAPEVWFEISASAVKIDIQLPGNAPASWVDGFIIFYGAKPGAERKCTLSGQTARYTCKGRCEAKSF
jgi:hypothetical protein